MAANYLTSTGARRGAPPSGSASAETVPPMTVHHSAELLARVDELIEEGRIETTDGPYPVLRVAA